MKLRTKFDAAYGVVDPAITVYKDSNEKIKALSYSPAAFEDPGHLWTVSQSGWRIDHYVPTGKVYNMTRDVNFKGKMKGAFIAPFRLQSIIDVSAINLSQDITGRLFYANGNEAKIWKWTTTGYFISRTNIDTREVLIAHNEYGRATVASMLEALGDKVCTNVTLESGETVGMFDILFYEPTGSKVRSYELKDMGEKIIEAMAAIQHKLRPKPKYTAVAGNAYIGIDARDAYGYVQYGMGQNAAKSARLEEIIRKEHEVDASGRWISKSNVGNYKAEQLDGSIAKMFETINNLIAERNKLKDVNADLQKTIEAGAKREEFQRAEIEAVKTAHETDSVLYRNDVLEFSKTKVTISTLRNKYRDAHRLMRLYRSFYRAFKGVETFDRIDGRITIDNNDLVEAIRRIREATK